MNRTNIEYLTHTWNPIAMRCTPVSEGCANCWHLKMADRMKNNPKLPTGRRDSYAGGPPVLIESELDKPLKLKKPSIIGLQFMGDLLNDLVAWNWQYKIFEMMLHAYWHTFIILTKRPKPETMDLLYFHLKRNYDGHIIPLPNVYLGVSVESDKYRWRIEELIKIPGKHLVSYEPALGPLNISKYLDPLRDLDDTYRQVIKDGMLNQYQVDSLKQPIIRRVIAGCESGSNHRPAKRKWFRELKDQCVHAGVPFFLKQMEEVFMFGHQQKRKVVKMPFLDGEIWNQMPK